MTSAAEMQAERMQANVRIPAALLMSAYAIIASLVVTDGAAVESWARKLVAIYGIYMAIAATLMLLVRHFPGHYPVRRGFAMLADYSAASISIIAGCTVMLPAYVFIVWIALGNGLRYGRRYLLIASALAQISILVIFAATPHWQADPVLSATLALTALVVPAFAYSLLRAKEQAEAATRAAVHAKSRYLAQASHDLRQPVHAMHLYLASLKQTGLSAGQQELVARLDRSLGGVATMFKSLLDLSAIDGGGTVSKPAPIAVQRLFDDLADQFARGDERDAATVNFVPSRHWVETDPMLLMNILQNLVGNARKHAPGSRVLVGCRKRHGQLAIMVCDQGPGVAPEHLPLLFDEFYQVRSGSTLAGAGVGLGLSIVRRLAELLGLTAEIRSVEGQGTTVYVQGLKEIPAASAAQLPVAPRRTFTTPLQGVRILLVEDEPDILALTANLLRGWGCEVEAFAQLPETPPPCDLIVTDYDIGGARTGLDVIARGRASAGRDIPAIIVSGHEAAVCHHAGTGSPPLLLGKPISPAELRSAISAMRAAA